MENWTQPIQIDQNVYNNAAAQLMNGKSDSEVIEMLTKSGVYDAEATALVSKLRADIAEAKAEKAQRDIKHGAMWCIGGLVVTGATYAMASDGGGSYLVCWGPVIFGGIQLIRGLVASGAAKNEQPNDGNTPVKGW